MDENNFTSMDAKLMIKYEEEKFISEVKSRNVFTYGFKDIIDNMLSKICKCKKSNGYKHKIFGKA